MINAQAARAGAENALVMRRTKILKSVESAVLSAMACGEMSVEVEEPEDTQVLATLTGLGFAVDYVDGAYYHLHW